MPSAHAKKAPSTAPDSRSTLEEIIRRIGHLLPAQGPIGVFVHHNTLHAFEHLPFDDAVVEASRLFGCQPYLSERRYREELERGRIQASDVDAVLAADLGTRAEAEILPGLTRHELRRRMLLYGLHELSGSSLAWTLTETTAVSELRTDLPRDARESLGAISADRARRNEVAQQARALWTACSDAVQRTDCPDPEPGPCLIRHRDLLLRAADIDVDEWVHPLLARITSAYLDQGLADWAMPGRDRGLWACFLDLYQHRLARICRPLGSKLQRLVREEITAARDSWASLEESLSKLGVPVVEWESFLLAESLAQRGFAGMVHQFEVRPDRVPVFSLPARLADFLATRLLLLRAALAHARPRTGFLGDLSQFRSWLQQRLPGPEMPSSVDRAWRIFQLAQLAGLSARDVEELSAASVKSLERELREFDEVGRRRLFHRAYERHLRHRFFDALVGHPAARVREPAYQAIFCVDEREESMRRHLEEIDPDVETFGAPGFYGVAMYYRAATDAHARPLSPVAIEPRHYVAEVHAGKQPGLRERMRARWNRIGALVDKNVHLSGRRARLGALVFATVGVFWVLPLVLRVVFPRLARSAARLYDNVYVRRGRLALECTAPGAAPPIGERVGFTRLEMAEIVLSQLSSIGIRDRFAPLVLVFGHGSTSLNNPHKSAYDCGACGGGRGGPNARAFAQMANNPAVRKLVADSGLHIPPGTWFVAGERNTSSNDLHLFDLEEIPDDVRALLPRACASLDEARRREAHERCRRFESAALALPPAAALLHVQGRATDLAQPRPECGHASNAVCFVGRRLRTRGLFLDRRAFLVSYDPLEDVDGALLRKLLSGIVPVVAGISLEYLFGYVDPTGYGSGTKLPHNVTALVGVMDGAQSDLRTGLPWQMLELHEPVRLTIVVEADEASLRGLVDQDPYLKQLVDNGWIALAALDPRTNALVELSAAAARPYVAEHDVQFTRDDSRRHYDGHRDHLPFASVYKERGAESCAG